MPPSALWLGHGHLNHSDCGWVDILHRTEGAGTLSDFILVVFTVILLFLFHSVDHVRYVVLRLSYRE